MCVLTTERCDGMTFKEQSLNCSWGCIYFILMPFGKQENYFTFCFVRLPDTFTLCLFPLHATNRLKRTWIFFKWKKGRRLFSRTCDLWMLRKSKPTCLAAGAAFASSDLYIKKNNDTKHITSEYIHTCVCYSVQNSNHI